MTHEEATQLLLDNGFTDGWAMAGDVLLLWFHDADPPSPLIRPETPAVDDLVEGEQP